MKKIIKPLLILVSMISITSILASCGANKPKEPAPQTSTQAPSDTASEIKSGFPKDKNITFIVPGKSGGGSDLAIRYLTASMNKNLGVTSIASNTDNNTIGHQTLATSKNDGTFVTLATAALNIQYITGIAELDPMNDLTLIACLQDNGYTTLAVPANAPYNNFSEFVEYAKANPGKINAGQPNSGNNQFQFGMLMKENDIQLNPVEASSESDRLTSLAGGFIDIGFVGIKNAREYEEAGKLKVIGTLADKGKTIANFDSALPENYKTLEEQGFANCYWSVHHYVFGPAGMDALQVEAMNAELKTVIEDKECNDGISSLGQIPEWYNVEDSHKMQKAEFERLVEVAKSLGIHVKG